jgi:hypothetical protein
VETEQSSELRIAIAITSFICVVVVAGDREEKAAKAGDRE